MEKKIKFSFNHEAAGANQIGKALGIKVEQFLNLENFLHKYINDLINMVSKERLLTSEAIEVIFKSLVKPHNKEEMSILFFLLFKQYFLTIQNNDKLQDENMRMCSIHSTVEMCKKCQNLSCVYRHDNTREN